MEVMARGWGGCGVWTVDDNAWGSKQEVIQQLLDQRRTWRQELHIFTLHIIDLNLTSVSAMCACFFACAHRDVPSHCHTVRAGSWWGGGVLPGGCCLPRWSPSQSSNWAQSCRAKRSRPQAWWLRSLLSPPSLKLKEEDIEYKVEKNTEL